MATEIRKEQFTGIYDGVTPAGLLPKGSISGGKNIRKVSQVGGWKGRKGCTLNNTTAAETGSAIDSLHQYTNPKQSDYHFIAQVNSKLLDATNDPPASGTTFGSDLGVTVGTTPGFSCLVGEFWFFADGSGRPVAYGGTDPSPIGFISHDDSEDADSDYLTEVTDGRTTTSGLILAAAADYFIILTQERCEGITLDLGDVNSNVETITVSAWRSGSWTGVSGTSDGTLSGGATLAQDGDITWTRSTSDDLKVVGNTMGYAYKFTWSGALSGSVTVLSCTCACDADLMTNKWNGLWEWVTGCRFYDQSVPEYQENLGKISNESDAQYMDLDAATTSDFIYVKAPEPITGVGFGVVIGNTNSANAQIDLIEYWDGDSWTTVGTLDDTTLDDAADSSFSQTGRITWDATALTPRKRTFEGDDLAGYWYRVSWDAALSADTRVYAVLYAPAAEVLPTQSGVIEFKGRLFCWGEDNRLRYSSKDKPFSFSGADSGYTDPFGGEDKILCCVKFYNELVIFKKDSVWLLEGYSPSTFGILGISDVVGISSIKSAQVADVGYPAMNADEPESIIIWQDVDGVYVLDGRKPKKVSGPVNNYFDPEFSPAIAAGSINSLQAFVSPLHNEYHLLIPSGELVFNYQTDEWYPPWERGIDLACAMWLEGTDNRKYTYGGTSTGFVMKLEDDTTDKNASNADLSISYSIKSRAFGALEEQGVTLEFAFRRTWGEFKSQTFGKIVTKVYKNEATVGIPQSTPDAITLVNTGYNLSVGKIDMSPTIVGCNSMQTEFSSSTRDLVFEIWSFIVELEVTRLIDT